MEWLVKLVSQSPKQHAKPKLYAGARKTSRATAAISPGAGRIRINGRPLEVWEPSIARMHILAPAMIAGELRDKFDVDVTVSGGGFMSQADAVAMAIARGFTDLSKGSELRTKINAYNKYLLSGDPRQSEPKKFGGPGARRKRQKSYR